MTGDACGPVEGGPVFRRSLARCGSVAAACVGVVGRTVEVWDACPGCDPSAYIEEA